MSVSDELSGEVAVALLEVEGAVMARDLKDVLSLLRSTLRGLSSEERQRRRERLTPGRPRGLTLSAKQGAA